MVDDKSLEERMITDLVQCFHSNKFQKLGLDSDKKPTVYCTYFHPTSIKEPVTCCYKAKDQTLIMLAGGDDPLYRNFVTFYKCTKRKS
mgnify:FL=1